MVFDVFLKVPVIIIIRFGENKVLGTTYIDVYKFWYIYHLAITAVMAKWLAWQTAVLSGASSSPAWMQVFSARSLHRPTVDDTNTGPTEFIISIVNSVKMVNRPKAWPPLVKEGKSVGILLLYQFLGWAKREHGSPSFSCLLFMNNENLQEHDLY